MGDKAAFRLNVERQSQAIVNQLRTIFVEDGDSEAYPFAPTLPYRGDSVICTDLIIAKIIETITSRDNAKLYMLLMMFQFVFKLNDRKEFRDRFFHKLGVINNVYSFSNPDDFLDSLREMLETGGIGYVNVTTNSLPYHYNYRGSEEHSEVHEVLIAGCNNKKKCFICYDNSVSYGIRLFDELADTSVFFRLYLEEEALGDMVGMHGHGSYSYNSFRKREVPTNSLWFQEEVREILSVYSRSPLSELITDIENGVDYKTEFLKMACVGSCTVLFEIFEDVYKLSDIEAFQLLKREALEFRNRAFNLLFKYIYSVKMNLKPTKQFLQKLASDSEEMDSKMISWFTDFLSEI